MKNKYPWTKEHQALLAYSALRVYELVEPDEKEVALRLASELGNGIAPNSDTFSPVTLKNLRDSNSKMEMINIPVTGWIKCFDLLNVNGKDIWLEGKTKIKVPSGEHLFSFYSSRFVKFNFVGTGTALVSVDMQPSSIVGDDCSLNDLRLQKTTLVIDDEGRCSTKNSASNSSHIAHLKPTGSLDAKNNPLNQTVVNIQPKKKWWQNKWIWIGAAVAASYVVYDQTQSSDSRKRHSNPQPTVSYER